MEKDWKIFRKMAPHLRERYLMYKNKEIKKILEDKDKNETDRFWAAREQIEKERKILIDCLDGHSRSKMLLHMRLMYRYGMITEDDLNEFSEELRSKIREIKNMDIH